ncbi:DUF3795 domain-containing protein [Lentimicrobium sp.]|uniref:DUF3795 domain-containing protein n=1 Tax=Lentimicrobium sp. TaxID=2034841 RepID=UPI002B85CFB0|nr:DUF3795 domain-containing protein [Lentimicrobium sp.]HPJ63406.1 DUF3795 domain-containing protein [Lentimicrobium sp.]
MSGYTASVISPCGINCTTCYAFQRSKNRCSGCRNQSGYKPNYCVVCKIVNCERLAMTLSGFCHECDQFPCARLKQLDKRYRNKYHSSLVGNLRDLKAMGPEAYMEREDVRCRCSRCGTVICIHSDACQQCGLVLPGRI